jgi:hypothetical protein
MTNRIRIASVGPSLCIKGGVSRVIELIATHLPEHISVRFIATFTRYTGDKGATASERGSRFIQAMIYFMACSQTLVLALGRRTVFHVHFSGKGSLLRKGAICVTLRALRCQYVVHSHAAHTSMFPPWVPHGSGMTIIPPSFIYQPSASFSCPTRRTCQSRFLIAPPISACVSSS